MVLQTQNEPGWLRLPRSALEILLREEVGVRREMCRPDQFLLLFGKIPAEKLSPTRKHPGVSISDFDAREDIRWILVELLLYGLADIGGDRSDVHEASYAIIDARSGNCGSAIRVPNEENRVTDAVKRALNHGHVLFERFQA